MTTEPEAITHDSGRSQLLSPVTNKASTPERSYRGINSRKKQWASQRWRPSISSWPPSHLKPASDVFNLLMFTYIFYWYIQNQLLAAVHEQSPHNCENTQFWGMQLLKMMMNEITVVILLRQFVARHPLNYLQIKPDKNENFRICLLRDCIL